MDKPQMDRQEYVEERRFLAQLEADAYKGFDKKQRWEFDYAVKQVLNRAPEGTTKKEAKEALTEAASEIAPSEGRDKIMKEALKNLKD